MAEAHPSKVGATCASNTTGSISTGFSPAWRSASARVAPAIPAPAMMTSTSWGAAALTGSGSRLRPVLGEAHDVEAGVNVDHLAGGRQAKVAEQPKRAPRDALHGRILLHGRQRLALGQHPAAAR